MRFCAGTLAVLVLSWIKKDNKIGSSWQQVPALINYLLDHSNQMICPKQLIQQKRKKVGPSEWMVESLAQLISSKTD